MKEFKFLDYCTEYSCEGSLERAMQVNACFSYVFREVKNNSSVKYQIVLYMGTRYSAEQHKSNACIFTKQEVRNHLKLLKSLYPLQYSVRDYGDKNGYKRLLITLNIENTPATFHKYALTWLRYLYEFPYNVLLRDAYTLKKERTFRFESIANLFNLTLSCYCENPREIHQIPTNSIIQRLKLADVKRRIKQVNFLSNIYKKEDKKVLQIPKKIQGFSVEDIEYWNVGFGERKPIYMEIQKRRRR